MQCSLNLIKGDIDGEIGRSAEQQNKIPNSIRVEEPFYILKYALFAVDSNIKLNSLEDLKRSDYRVAVTRGDTYWRNKIETLKDDIEIVYVVNCSSGLKQLASGEVDIFICHTLCIEHFPFNGNRSEIRKIEIFEHIPLYIYLHPDHIDLASKIGNEIKAMKTEGVIKALEKQAVDEFLSERI